MIINDPKMPEKIFLISKFIIKYILDRTTITKKILPVGLCLVKKDINKIIGMKNQQPLEFVFIAKIKNNKEIIDSIEA